MSKKIKNSKLNSTHLLDDDSEIEDNTDVNWGVKSNNASEEENNSKNEKKDEDEDEEYYDYKEEDDEDIVENIVLPKKKNKKSSEPEINIEIIKGEKNEKCVQITIKMALENKTRDIITIDFTINKKTFLKIAKELK
jgi:hypothetical protein